MTHLTRKRVNRSMLFGSSSLSLMILATAPAQAQVADAPATPQAVAAAPTDGLGEIVVTARRREENLQKVPISITAYTAKDLTARQIDNISQIAASTPNLTFNSSAPVSGSNTAASIFIRGIGQTDFTLVTDPGVGLYLDGVYIARSVGGVLDLVDVQRVEVLRGPQGTLFGKNTIGGAINITSTPPTGKFDGSIQLTTGSRKRIDGKAVINFPVSSTLAIRLSGATLNQGGYVNNLNGPKLGNTKAILGRAAIHWTPAPNFKVDISADYTRRRERAQAMKLLDFNPNAGAPTFGPYNGVVAPALGLPIFDSRFTLGGPYQTFQGDNPLAISNLNLWGVSATAELDVSDALAIKSITAYRKFDSQFGRDSDNSPSTIVETYDDIRHHQFSQELQLFGKTASDSIEWLVGGYYFNERGNDLNNVYTSVLLIQSGGEASTRSKAAFGHLVLHATDKLRVTGGLRYTNERKTFLPNQKVLFYSYTQSLFGGAGFTDGQAILPSVTSERSFNNLSAMAGLDYQWTSRFMTYLSLSQGFKSGGFNQRVFPPRASPGSFAPEKADVAEVGFKWSNDAGTVRLDADTFYTRYKNIQVKIIDVVAPGTGNAAKGRIYGGEAELTLKPVSALTLNATAGYLNTAYTGFAANFDPAQGINKNNRFVNSPKWSFSAAANYVIPLGDTGSLTVHGDWGYRSKTYNDAANSERIAQKAYSLFNANLLFNTADRLWQVSAGVRNIGDKAYLLTGNDEFNGFGYVEGVYGKPREWNLTVKRSF